MKRMVRTREAWLAGALILMVALVELRAPGFLAFDNINSILFNTSLLIILALGQTVVIITRSIDLSMASNLALTGMIVALINQSSPGVPIPLLIVLATLVGLALGAFNGILVWRLRIPAIVVTLGTLAIFRGTIFIIAGGQWVNANEMTESFIQTTRVEFIGLPLLTWFAVAAFALFFFLMRYTPLGRSIYAVGVNPTAAVYAGINVGRTIFIAFCISGAAAGLVGYLWVSRYVIGSSEVASGYELTVIAACVIGGVSIAGGVGGVVGATLGALFLGVIDAALPVIKVSPFWQMAIEGTAIILAVIANARSQRAKGRIILRESENTG